MLADTTWETIHRWVARRLDLTPADVARGSVWVKTHGPALADYHGIYTWLIGQTVIVSAPAGWDDTMRHALADLSPDTLAETLTDAAFWRGALGERVERVVGPSYQGFLDAHAFRAMRAPQTPQGARPLTSADLPALTRFVAACPPADWSDSAIDLDHQPIFGVAHDGELVALASAPADGLARSVGVVTLPAWRGMGAGRAVVGALTARCLAEGAILRYQTLRANVASVAIARALGYEDAATAMGVRLLTS